MIVGMDIGTNSSSVALHNGAEARLIEAEGEAKVTPSAVYIDGDDIRIGTEALVLGRKHPSRLFRHFKRLIGREWDASADLGWQACEGPDGMTWMRGERPDELYSPVYLTELLIRSLLDSVDRREGFRPTTAVVCVPAGFDHLQREATQLAATNAGLETVYLVNEPTAAATAYGAQHSRLRTVAVVDWGAGTFDFTILQARKTLIEPLGSDGDTQLGGRDVDLALGHEIQRRWIELGNGDLASRDHAWERVLDASEDAKISLSSRDVTTIELMDIEPPKHLKMVVTQAELSELAAPQIRRVKAICRALMARIDTGPSDIDDVVLVGGMTYMPALRTAVEEVFQKRAKREFDPKTVVALGAATYGAIQEGRIRTVIRTIAPHTLSVEKDGDIPVIIVAKNTDLPMIENVVFTSVEDDQAALSINLLQGDELRASGRTVIMRHFAMIDPQPAGDPRFVMRIGYDENGDPVFEPLEKAAPIPDETVEAGPVTEPEAEFLETEGDPEPEPEVEAEAPPPEPEPEPREQMDPEPIEVDYEPAVAPPDDEREAA